jgi:hypothetical protein
MDLRIAFDYRSLAKAVIEEAIRDLFSMRNTDNIFGYISAIDFIADDYVCGLYCDVAEIDYGTLRGVIMNQLIMRPKYSQEELVVAISRYKPVIQELKMVKYRQ